MLLGSSLEGGPDGGESLGRDGCDQLVLAGEVAVDRARGETDLAQDVLHRRGVEAVAAEAARGAVQDLAAAGVEVFLGYASHAPNVERAFILDKRHSLQPQWLI